MKDHLGGSYGGQSARNGLVRVVSGTVVEGHERGL